MRDRNLKLVIIQQALIQRAFTAKTRKRIGIVESAIRGDIEYNGPRVTEDIALNSTFAELFDEAKSQFVWIPYSLLIIAVTLLGFFAT